MQTGVWCQVRHSHRPRSSLLFLKPQSTSEFSLLQLDMASPLLRLAVAFHLSPTFTPLFPPHPPTHPHPPYPSLSSSLSLCLCFPLLNCFAVDLTAMINDLKASGKQTEGERDTTSLPFPYKPPFSFFHVSVPALREGSKKKYRVNWSGCCYAEINVGDETAAFWWRLLNSVVSESFETMGNKTRSGINYGFLTLIVRKRDMTVTLGYFNSVVKMWAAAAVKAAKRLFPPNWRLVLLLGQNPG